MVARARYRTFPGKRDIAEVPSQLTGLLPRTFPGKCEGGVLRRW